MGSICLSVAKKQHVVKGDVRYASVLGGLQ